MGFMHMSTTFDRWARVEASGGSSETVPFDVAEDVRKAMGDGATIEDLGMAWGARLSAPGYMDATDWDAPHSTEAEAVAAVDKAFDLCHECHDNHEGEGCGEGLDS